MNGNYGQEWKDKLSISVKQSEYCITRKNENEQKKIEYNANPKLCLKCKIPIQYEKRNNKFCSSACNASFHTKGKIRTIETRNKISNSLKNSEIFKDSNKRTIINRITNRSDKKYHSSIKICPICNNQFFGYGVFCGKLCYLKDVSSGYIYGTKPKSGGYRQGSGRGKSGWYKGIFCNSSYELAWVIYNLEHNIPFQRNNKGFNYLYKGKEYKYYPDFIMPENNYIELKGFLTDKDKAKIESFPHNLKILYGTDIKIELNYVKEKYGIHFISLYEGNPHNNRLNKCVICGEPAKLKCCSQKCSGILRSKMVSLTGIEPVSLQDENLTI